jgi:hypothetical protein
MIIVSFTVSKTLIIVCKYIIVLIIFNDREKSLVLIIVFLPMVTIKNVSKPGMIKLYTKKNNIIICFFISFYLLQNNIIITY